MRQLLLFGLEIVVSLALNLTASILNKPQAVTLSKWCWLVVLLHASYLVLSVDRVTHTIVGLRSLFGRQKMVSYVVVALASAALGVIYWAGINAIYGRLLTEPVQGVAYCYLDTSLYAESDELWFFLHNETDKPVKELQFRLDDDGAVSRYLKERKPSEQPTVQGVESARQSISMGPLPTIIPHTAVELKQLRRRIGNRNSWSFSVHMQTDTHLFWEVIYWKRLPAGWTNSHSLSVNDPKRGWIKIWSRTKR